jgi:calcium-translocating P-type ATPase
MTGATPLNTPTIDAPGLASADAEELRRIHGSNELPESPPVSLVRRVAQAAADPLSLLLIAAGVISAAVLNETVEGTAIIAIVIVNIVVRVTQEQKADAAIRSLRAYAAPMARTRRDGSTKEIPASELVPGDVVELGAGERVPADMRTLSATRLLVDESLLTGESVPVPKIAGESEALAGTMVLGGHGFGEVIRTGANSELGKVSSLMTAAPPAPLERELRSVSMRVSLLACAIGLVMSGIAYTRVGPDFSATDAVLSGVAIAIAAVPEGLVIAVTLALAVGAQRMARQGMIVKRLSAIEALGAASVLCSDKTGTLTEGRLSLARAVGVVDEERLWTAILRSSEPAVVSGDPVDVVMANESQQRNIDVTDELLVHHPFDSDKRLAATIHSTTWGPLLTVKGAPEVVLARCAAGPQTNELLRALPMLLEDGLRVIAIAEAPTDDLESDNLEPLGLVALSDALRATARAAVDDAKRAGISVVMVTGDHASTAAAIGRQAGIVGSVVTSDDLHELSPQQRAASLDDAAIVARVDPATKVALIDTHQQAGHVVAMTGDGVNDAPALRRSDVGIAVMGSGGTDVAREAADLIVTGGDLNIILTAIQEGRRIYRNIVNVVTYLLSGNLCEIIVVAIGLLVFPELAVPLLPVQILWINLVTDGMPALALGMDRPRQDLLHEPPRSPKQHVLNAHRFQVITSLACALAIPVLGVTWLALSWNWTDGAVRALLVTSLVVGRLGIAYVVQSDSLTFHRGFWRGRTLLIAVTASLLAQIATVTIPPLRAIFEFSAMPATGWLLVLGVLVVTVALADGMRQLTRKLGQRSQSQPLITP